MNRLPHPKETLSEVIEFRAFPGMAKEIRKAVRDFPSKYSSDSHVIRSALMKFFRELDKERLLRKAARRKAR